MQALHQEVRRTHAGFDRPERMFDGFASGAHCLRVLIKATLDVFQNVLVFPSINDTVLCARTSVFELAIPTCGSRIAPSVQALGITFMRDEQQDFSGRADVHILAGNIAEIRLSKLSPCSVIGGLWLWQRHTDARFSAFQNLLAGEVTTVSHISRLAEPYAVCLARFPNRSASHS